MQITAKTSGPNTSRPVKQGLRAENVTVSFDVSTRWPGRSKLTAINDVTLFVESGAVTGLVGESGCGKSTIARVLTGLQIPSSGTVSVDGRDLAALNRRNRQLHLSRDISIVFQDASSSLNPRMNVSDAVRDPLDIHQKGTPAERRERVEELLQLVGLPTSTGQRLPRELSGGQRQRVAIARALALDPKYLIADEPTSALDVSVRAQVLTLLVELRQKLGFGVLYISHDIQTVRYLADRIAVMYLGRIVELGPADKLWRVPKHPYTKALLSASTSLIGKESGTRVILEGSVPSARNPPSGCPFRTRCWRADDLCASKFPEQQVLDGSYVHCFHPLEHENDS